MIVNEEGSVKCVNIRVLPNPETRSNCIEKKTYDLY